MYFLKICCSVPRFSVCVFLSWLNVSIYLLLWVFFKYTCLFFQPTNWQLALPIFLIDPGLSEFEIVEKHLPREFSSYSISDWLLSVLLWPFQSLLFSSTQLANMVKFDVRPMLNVTNGSDVSASVNISTSHNDNTINVSEAKIWLPVVHRGNTTPIPTGAMKR